MVWEREIRHLYNYGARNMTQCVESIHGTGFQTVQFSAIQKCEKQFSKANDHVKMAEGF